MPSRFFLICLGIIVISADFLWVGAAYAAIVGSVTRIQGDASALLSSETRHLTEGSAIQVGDRLQTGADARLEVTFIDGTMLTLGERADFTVDELSIGQERGTALFTRLAGAIVLAGGDIAKMPQHKIEIASNAGTIGIRGTKVWGGVVKPGSLLDVFLIEGEVEVRTPGGTVVLNQPGEGTSVTAMGRAPDTPLQWRPALRDQALATVAFTAP
jgi:hypothetical protein